MLQKYKLLGQTFFYFDGFMLATAIEIFMVYDVE